MQLTGPEIMRQMNAPNPNNPDNKPNIIITPFNEKCLGSNSYDLHLGNKLKIYKRTSPDGMKLAIEYEPGREYSMADCFHPGFDMNRYRNHPEDYDARNPKFMLDPFDKDKETVEIEIPQNGLILSPSIGYLGATTEYTETRNLFPYIDGKSSIGRNFIITHCTAGRGDDGFCGTWTLEIRVMYPTLVRPNMRIGQIYYEMFVGERKIYGDLTNAHYNGQISPTQAAAVPIEKI